MEIRILVLMKSNFVSLCVWCSICVGKSRSPDLLVRFWRPKVCVGGESCVLSSRKAQTWIAKAKGDSWSHQEIKAVFILTTGNCLNQRCSWNSCVLFNMTYFAMWKIVFDSTAVCIEIKPLTALWQTMRSLADPAIGITRFFQGLWLLFTPNAKTLSTNSRPIGLGRTKYASHCKINIQACFTSWQIYAKLFSWR